MIDQRHKKLLFIYNANSGIRNILLDGAHKILSPSTYECNLCDITFGAFTENKGWKKFRKETTMEMDFLHKDEFAKQYASKFGHKFTFPIILAATTDGLEVFVHTEELNALDNANRLIDLIQKREEVYFGA